MTYSVNAMTCELSTKLWSKVASFVDIGTILSLSATCKVLRSDEFFKELVMLARPDQYKIIAFQFDYKFSLQQYVRILYSTYCFHCISQNSAPYLNFKLRLCFDCLQNISVQTTEITEPFTRQTFVTFHTDEIGRAHV